jgi:hypothetical protein
VGGANFEADVRVYGGKAMRPAMKALILAFGISLTAGAVSIPAQAQNYPWCAYYDNGQAGTNCGFSTFQQCMTTLSGMGGFCDRNTQYVPAPGPHSNPRHR